MTSNYEFIAAAYLATGAVLGGFAWWMKRRLKNLARQGEAWQASRHGASSTHESSHEPQS